MKNKVLKKPLIVLTVCLRQHMCVYWHHKDSREAGERSYLFWFEDLPADLRTKWKIEPHEATWRVLISSAGISVNIHCLAHMLMRTNGFVVSWKLFVQSDFLCAASEVDVSARAAASWVCYVQMRCAVPPLAVAARSYKKSACTKRRTGLVCLILLISEVRHVDSGFSLMHMKKFVPYGFT